MSCETFTTNIDGNDYAYTQLTASKSLTLKYRLAGMLGSAVTDIVPAVGKSDEVQVEAFGKAVQDVFSKNDPEKVVDVITKIFVPAFRNKERIDMDRDFTGNTGEMYKALFWILGCEYGNFIKGLGELAGK